ncbi:MAG: 50S ribosomal protein L10 [Candidatus Taylorbacteria bacterium RIFCSPHIGHO2_02_FULL_46_13]|uniref:Large ribosomal subunit protein uL10 n=1 Tax=Candidatus Taylorbacteria bacterium RIFCSPHIGHO2_02_FULL_46_13 TaxID=1802312 RepID=A0A1G2MTZ2_9BACT|nr:MAG: 50S ribosomal protein L10 [Candidatus Taylorbacteria bacterium RIFCSPHIGHO2_02_FULL_46_13]
MAKNKTQKQQALDELSGVLKKAKTVVFAGFNKLTVSEATQTRKAMRASGVKFLVVKKTLLAKSLADNSFGATTALPGQVALAYGPDLIAPAREVFAAGKKFDSKLSILGGIFEGVLVDKEKMSAIASIPSREVLYGQFVNLINSPIQCFVIALNAIASRKTG